MQRERYVPLDKMSKKERRKYYAAQRSDWNGVVPVTKIVPNKKKEEQTRRKHVCRPDEA